MASPIRLCKCCRKGCWPQSLVAAVGAKSSLSALLLRLAMCLVAMPLTPAWEGVRNRCIRECTKPTVPPRVADEDTRPPRPLPCRLQRVLLRTDACRLARRAITWAGRYTGVMHRHGVCRHRSRDRMRSMRRAVRASLRPMRNAASGARRAVMLICWQPSFSVCGLSVLQRSITTMSAPIVHRAPMYLDWNAGLESTITPQGRRTPMP